MRAHKQIGRISLAHVTLIESPLEFVQQHLHDTLMDESNFYHHDEANLREMRHQQRTNPIGARKRARVATITNKNSSCNSISAPDNNSLLASNCASGK